MQKRGFFAIVILSMDMKSQTYTRQIFVSLNNWDLSAVEQQQEQ